MAAEGLRANTLAQTVWLHRLQLGRTLWTAPKGGLNGYLALRRF